MKKQAFNPYLPLNEYVPDAEPHVFGNRVYVFGSHDQENGSTFCMLDYVVWSAPVDDLSDWSNTGIVYRAEQDPLYNPDSSNHQVYMYAPDCVQGNDGRFYLYYCMAGEKGRGGYANPISVAVSDCPDGTYTYLGTVHDKTGMPLKKYICFDPAVLNDAGTIRLYYGTYYPSVAKLPGPLRENAEEKLFGRAKAEIRAAEHTRTEDGKTVPDDIMGAVHVELEDDMLTAKTEPVKIAPDEFRKSGHPFYEGSSIRKICFSPEGQAIEASQVGGDFDRALYYFVYSSRQNHELCYATSVYPDRGFTFGGTIVSNGDIGFQGRRPHQRLNHTGTTHGGIEQIGGNWFVFYHRLTNQSDYCRQGCAELIDIGADGAIAQVEMTSCGLNIDPLDGGSRGPVTYPAAICCNLTNGKMRQGSNRDQGYDAPKIMAGAEKKSIEKEERELAELQTAPEDADVTGDAEECVERFVGQIRNGTIIGYKYFFFEAGEVTLTVRVRGTGGGVLYVCTTGDGLAKESIDIGQSAKWERYTVSWKQEAGVAPLYLCYSGRGTIELLDFTLG